MKKRVSRPPLFEVRHSPIHGYGVFALRRIRKGTTVTEYLGERVSHEEADARYEDKDPDDNHTFLFTVDSKTVIDGGVGGSDSRFINHGCEPNCESTTLNKRIYIEAIRTIQPGEELAYDYQIERDSGDPANVDEIFACRCGAAKCRGTMLLPRKKPRKKVHAKKRVDAEKRKKSSKRAAKKAGAIAGERRSAVASPRSGTAAQRGTSSQPRSPRGPHRVARQSKSGRPRSASPPRRSLSRKRRGTAR